MLYWDEALPDTRPGILLVHGGAGLDEHAREQAQRYAALGYVVHACDMLGDGVAGERARGTPRPTAPRADPARLVPPAAPPPGAAPTAPPLHRGPRRRGLWLRRPRR